MQAMETLPRSCVQVPAQRCSTVVPPQQGLQAAEGRRVELGLDPDGAQRVVGVHDDGRLAWPTAQQQAAQITAWGCRCLSLRQ